ncbi:retrovirus-related pol polyprotein from transposon TNT 1-94 [Tanacetum coccineum]
MEKEITNGSLYPCSLGKSKSYFSSDKLGTSSITHRKTTKCTRESSTDISPVASSLQDKTIPPQASGSKPNTAIHRKIGSFLLRQENIDGSRRQFCDSDLEVAFRKHTCFVRDINGTDILKGSRGTNLYTISIDDMMKSSPICLLSKASKSKSWLWHRRLNHLNFGTINDLARKDLVRGLPRLKFEKDHLCSACQLGKSKKFSHRPKSENTNMEVLNTLHMDLCGPMRVQSIKGKKYILVIVDDYSRFTWVKFLSSKEKLQSSSPTFLKANTGWSQQNSQIHPHRSTNGIPSTSKCLNTMKVWAYFIKSLFRELLNKTELWKDVIVHCERKHTYNAKDILESSHVPWAEAVVHCLYTPEPDH